MNADEIITELKALNIADLDRINKVCVQLAKHKENWKSKQVIASLETGQRVKVKAVGNHKEFLGTVTRLKQLNVFVQEDGSFRTWDTPGYMVSLIGETNGISET